MKFAALVSALFLALPVTAQDQQAAIGTGAILRGLDKVSGEVTDMVLAPGAQAAMGRITVELSQCRYPEGDPASDAYAFVSIREDGTDQPVFSGWMIASSPALNALDHPRYDVWVLRCQTE
jgi:hypothetical protein